MIEVPDFRELTFEELRDLVANAIEAALESDPASRDMVLRELVKALRYGVTNLPDPARKN